MAVSLLNADGTTALATRIIRDRHGDVTSVDDGRGATEIAYNRSGFPVLVKDPIGNATKICYIDFHTPVSVTDADGMTTKYDYNDAGLVTRMERLFEGDVVSSLDVSYDGMGRPVAYTDQDGLTKSFERDAFGKVLTEKFPDGSECAYSYDALGRRTSVIDENGHEIRFGWGRFGLESRTTAAGQLTDYVRDDLGLIKEVVSKWNDSEDRHIRTEYDEFRRPVRVEYDGGEDETFAYDKWGRLSVHTRGRTKETCSYDHFGRLTERKEYGLSTRYSYDAWGNRTARTTRDRKGTVVSSESRAYDKFGRLSETKADGMTVSYRYDKAGRVSRQTVNGTPIDFSYTKRGLLAGKYLGGRVNPESSVEYEYSKSGRVVARTANGVRQTYEYDRKGQLLAVKDSDGNAVERYVYDKAGNMLKKQILRSGRAGAPRTPQSDDYITTTFAFDSANQLVSSTTDGVTTRYAYDAAGRLVREGSKTYRYGYLDKVMSVTDGDTTRTFTYHADGQLASATVGTSSSRPGRDALVASDTETFQWDGLALIQRGDEQFVNEPHIGGGNPVASSKGTSYFNDALGTTVGSKQGGKYSAAALTAFGEDLTVHSPTQNSNFFTGKPFVEGLGHSFLMRNYRAGLAKWQSADPMGYPDGWNQLVYCNNGVTSAVDLWGAKVGNPTAIMSDNGPIPSVGIGVAEKGYHEIVPPYKDIVLDLLLDGTIVLNDDDKEVVSRFIRSDTTTETGNTIYIPIGSGHPYRIDTETTIREEWHEISFELTITKDTAMSTLLKHQKNGSTIVAVSALVTAIPELGAAATIADAITLLEGCTRKSWRVQDRILLLADTSTTVKNKTVYLE
ncbi:MAG: hypothetical protein E7049_02595 [Lentisphaerae bacterium]|nr:hypothetical protein [Lentisphaerota bacterium]